MSRELKAEAGSCTVSREAAAFAAFPRYPQVLSWCEVLVSCPEQALPNFLPRTQFPPLQAA